jgi:hypothetical protein
MQQPERGIEDPAMAQAEAVNPVRVAQVQSY